MSLAHETFRVTSFNAVANGWVIRGVPIKRDHSVVTSKYHIRVNAIDGIVPVEPSVGQVWEVAGDSEFVVKSDGDFESTARVYRQPDHLDFKLPNDGESFIRFIANDPAFTGIGEAKARQLWSAFGPSIHEMLRRGSGTDLKALRGLLSDKSVIALYQGYAKYENLEHTAWMASVGIDLAAQRRILKYHKRGTIEALKTNPYELVHFGYTLGRVDAVIEASDCWSGMDLDVKRAAAIALLAMRRGMEDGSTFLTREVFVRSARAVAGNNIHTERALELVANSEALAVCSDGLSRIHPTATAIQELAVAKRISSLAAVTQPFDQDCETALAKFTAVLDYELTPQQLQAIRTSVGHAVSTICGGAGTGKTTVLNGVLSVLSGVGYEITAVALSGRAAARLHESIGFETKTIARFLRDENLLCTPDERRVLVIDEASMVDLPTMFRVVNHTSPHVKLILSGDPNQLPPIGVGKILKDVLDSGCVANTTLDVVKRQKGSTGIPEYSRSVNAGEPPAMLSTGAIEFNEVGKLGLVERAVDLFLEQPGESRVVAPTRQLVRDINKAIQSVVNPDGKRLRFNLYGDDLYLDIREGDQVLFTQNQYHLGVQNGSLGRLTLVQQDPNTDSFGTVLLDTGKEVSITRGLLESIELGYCVTLHKAQGSQFRRVIVVLANGRIIDRSWIYTAITRAEAEVSIVGSEKEFRRAVTDAPSAFRRRTFLQELLNELNGDSTEAEHVALES